jgi:hypothetical protein
MSPFTGWLGLTDRNAFYTDARAIAAFERYIDVLLSHVNRYTGRAYVNDPTVLAWELGNELNDMPASWIQTISTYLHRLAPRQLIAAGQQSGINAATLTAPYVDIVDCHYYPPTDAAVTADAQTVAAAGKVYLAGEYASTAADTALLEPLAGDHAVAGMAFWSLFPHADDHGYVEHDDGFTLHYPGDTVAARAEVAAITGYGAAVTPHRRLRTPPPRPPVITSIRKRAGLNRIGWRGDVTAQGYQVHRAERTSRWRVVGGADAPLTDTDGPWMDLTSPAGPVRYRVVSLDAAGQPLCTSAAVAVEPVADVVVDLLESWRTASSHTNLSVEPVQGRVQVAPAAGQAGTISWHLTGLSSIGVDLAGSVSAIGVPRVEYVAVGGSWQRARTRSHRHGRVLTLLAELPEGTNDVRLRWAPTPVPVAVTGVTLTSATASPATQPPGPFHLTRPAAGTGTPLTTPITWTAAAQAGYYSLVVSTHADLSAPTIAQTGLTTPSFVPTTVFDPTTTYYVQVQAHNLLGVSTAAGSPVRFTTGAAPTGVPIDDFERYLSDADLSAAYQRNTGGDPITVTLITDADGTGQGMRLAATLGGAGYAGVEHTLPEPGDWRGMNGIAFWLRPEQAAGTDWSLSLQFQAGGLYWQADLHPTGTQARTVTIPFADFANPPWATRGALDLRDVTAIALYLGGSSGGYVCALDSIRAYSGCVGRAVLWRGQAQPKAMRK